MIPGITDQGTNIEAMALFYKKHKIRKATLLPNNPAWIQKLDKIGRKTTFDSKYPIRKFYDKDNEQRIKEHFSERGIEVSFG